MNVSKVMDSKMLVSIVNLMVGLFIVGFCIEFSMIIYEQLDAQNKTKQCLNSDLIKYLTIDECVKLKH